MTDFNRHWAGNSSAARNIAADLLDCAAGAGVEATRLPATSDIVLIERSTLMRDCLIKCVADASGQVMAGYPSIAAFAEATEENAPALLILSLVGCSSRIEASAEIEALLALRRRSPNLVISNSDDADEVMNALDSGVQGYVSTAISLAVVVEAIRLVRAGGVYYPAKTLAAARRSAATDKRSSQPELFTARQAAVVDALRRGKANKIIAYELNMCESTVKVHVRNIMKKLKARNRTEVAVRANELLDS